MVGYVACMGGIKTAYAVWMSEVKGKSYCEGWCLTGQMRVKRMVKEREWMGVSWT